MDRELAKKLVQLVNDPAHGPLLQEYVQYRISQLLRQLESEMDAFKVRGIQKAIAELRRFETLKDEVLRAAQ